MQIEPAGDSAGTRTAWSNKRPAFVLHYAGWVALTLGAYREVEALLAESVALHRQTGSAGHLGWPLAQLRYTHCYRRRGASAGGY